MTLAQNLADFRAANIELMLHVGFANSKYANNTYKVSRNLREFISESAFLRMFIAWETFLEDSFVNYLLNEPSILNNRPAKWVSPRDRAHAQEIIIGNQKYMDWSNPESIRKLSQIFFHQGYVFNTTLGAINNDLMDLKAIRNSAAHMSSTTSAKLNGVSTRILNIPCVNYTAYRLLFSTDPRSGTAGLSVLTRYLQTLDIAAEQIAAG